MQPLSAKLLAKPLLIKKSANLGITPPTIYDSIPADIRDGALPKAA